jgi:hypothetical protein
MVLVKLQPYSLYNKFDDHLFGGEKRPRKMKILALSNTYLRQ